MTRKLFLFCKNKLAAVGFRTHAPEEIGALNQRLGPLGHATLYINKYLATSTNALQVLYRKVGG